ncbi:Vacuolar protease A [Boothiomyces sp. JEL0866]|nr:Vacuolar protease A [Boothiomyces sp. JEL0866]
MKLLVVLTGVVATVVPALGSSEPVIIPITKANPFQILLPKIPSTNNISLQDYQNQFYLAKVKIGKQFFQLAISTFYSDTWVKGPNCKSIDHSCHGNLLNLSDPTIKTIEDRDLQNKFKLKFDNKTHVQGDVYTGPISMGGLSANYPFGVGRETDGYVGCDGVIGFGLPGSSEIAEITDQMSTFFNDLGFLYGKAIFSIYLGNGSYGEISLFGIDNTKFKGSLHFVPLIPYMYWEFDISNVKFAAGKYKGSLGLNLKTAVLDVGSEQMILEKSVAQDINKGIGALPFNSTLGAYPILCSHAKTGKDVLFNFTSFVLSIPASIYVIEHKGWCVSGFNHGTFPFVIFGNVISRAYYTIYDESHGTIGFGKAV